MKRLVYLPAAGVIFIAMIFGYGHFVEARQLEVTHLAIDNPALSKALSGTRWVIFADLHIKNNDAGILKKLRSKIEELEPDYVIIPGDMMYYKDKPEKVVQWFKTLPKTKGYFAVLGDAETMGGARNCALCHVPGSKELRTDHPVKILRQDYITLDGPGGKVVLAGTDPEWLEPDLSFLADVPADYPLILITHYPDGFEQTMSRKADLVLAGDTHGGQIAAPRLFYSLLFRPERARYLEGLFKKGESTMYVTRGIGTSRIPIRLGSKPEVVVIDF